MRPVYENFAKERDDRRQESNHPYVNEIPDEGRFVQISFNRPPLFGEEFTHEIVMPLLSNTCRLQSRDDRVEFAPERRVLPEKVSRVRFCVAQISAHLHSGRVPSRLRVNQRVYPSQLHETCDVPVPGENFGAIVHVLVGDRLPLQRVERLVVGEERDVEYHVKDDGGQPGLVQILVTLVLGLHRVRHGHARQIDVKIGRVNGGRQYDEEEHDPLQRSARPHRHARSDQDPEYLQRLPQSPLEPQQGRYSPEREKDHYIRDYGCEGSGLDRVHLVRDRHDRAPLLVLERQRVIQQIETWIGEQGKFRYYDVQIAVHQARERVVVGLHHDREVHDAREGAKEFHVWPLVGDGIVARVDRQIDVTLAFQNGSAKRVAVKIGHLVGEPVESRGVR